MKAHTVAGEEEISVIRDFVRAGYSKWSDGGME
jgi:hypothetical protein